LSYAWDIDIPADTKEATPVKQTLKLTSGILTDVSFFFPGGCTQRVKVRLTRGGVFPVVPNNLGGWVTGNKQTILFRLYYELNDIPYELQFEGCSPGTSYTHKIGVFISMIEEEAASTKKLTLLLEKFLETIGAI